MEAMATLDVPSEAAQKPAPLGRKRTKYMCGHCAGAPMMAGGEPAALVSHGRCVFDECMCHQDQHQPTARVIKHQALFCNAAEEQVLATWTWDKKAMKAVASQPKVQAPNPPDAAPQMNRVAKSGPNRTLSPIEQLVELVPDTQRARRHGSPEPSSRVGKL